MQTFTIEAVHAEPSTPRCLLGHRFHSACGAGILRLATFARRMAPGNLRLPVEEVDALISGLDTASPATMFNPPAEQ